MIAGVSVNCFQGKNLSECIDILLELVNKENLEAIELRLEECSSNPSVWYSSLGPKLELLLNSFEIIGAHLPINGINLISQNISMRNSSINKITQGLDIAKELNVDYCVMHCRGSKVTKSSSIVQNEWKNLISTLTEYAEDRSLLLLVENADSITNLKTLVNIVKSIDSKSLKIALDIGHAHIREFHLSTGVKGFSLKCMDFLAGDLYRSNLNMPYGEYGSISNFISIESQVIKNIHIHDYNGREDHLPLGQGCIDFNFLNIMNQSYHGPCIIETFSKKPYSDLIQCYSTLKGCCR